MINPFARRARLRRAGLIAGVLAGVLVTAACGSGDADEQVTAGADSLQKVSLRLDWSYLPNHIPFLYGKDQGFYRDAGIDLDIREGKGSGSSIQLVANGSDDVAYAGTEGMLINRNKGMDVQSILLVQRRNSNATVCYKKVGLTSPKSLEGRSVIMVPGSAQTVLFPTYLKRNGVDESKIKVINSDSSNAYALFLAGKGDCYIGQYGNDTLRASQQNPEIGAARPWVDDNMEGIGHSLVVNSTKIGPNTELYRKFVAATVKSWQTACADQAAAAEFYIKNFPAQNKDDFWKNYARQALPFECEKTTPGPNDDGKAFGPTSDALMTRVIGFLSEYAGIGAAKEPSFYRTNDLLPQG